MSKRFLFLFSDTGGGHRSGAQAVAQAMAALYGDAAEVILSDVFVALGEWPFYRFPELYPRMLKAHGVPWKLGFELSDHRLIVNALTKLAAPYVKTSFQRLLARYDADVVVSFHSVPNSTLALAATQWGLESATATVVLDFLSAPAFWFAKGLDLYVVPYAEMLERTRRLGLSPSLVEVLGMPVRQEMLAGLQRSKEEARAQLGIEGSQPLVLLSSGGDGVGPLDAIAQNLILLRPQATIVVISGRNQRLRQRLASLAKTYPLRVEGFSKQMHLWLRAADILVTKAGPNTLAEAFIMGVPTVLFAAIPGQEDGNVALVEQYEAGIWAPGPQKSARAVLALLNDPQRRNRMAQQAANLATPDAAEKIARRLWRLRDIPASFPATRRIRNPAGLEAQTTPDDRSGSELQEESRTTELS